MAATSDSPILCKLLLISCRKEEGCIEEKKKKKKKKKKGAATLDMAMIQRAAALPFAAAASHVTNVAHVFALTAAILMLVWIIHFRGGAKLHSANNKDLIFNVHPLVMCLGFILIIGEGIMAYKTIPAMKRVRKSIHMMLQLVALILGIFGVYATFKYHKESDLPDMNSLHSWLGICTISLFGLQWLGGFLVFWMPHASITTRTMILPVHASVGLAIFLLTICTAETGLVQMDALPGPETRLINFTGLFIILFGITVSITVALPSPAF